MKLRFVFTALGVLSAGALTAQAAAFALSGQGAERAAHVAWALAAAGVAVGSWAAALRCPSGPARATWVSWALGGVVLLLGSASELVESVSYQAAIPLFAFALLGGAGTAIRTVRQSRLLILLDAVPVVLAGGTLVYLTTGAATVAEHALRTALGSLYVLLAFLALRVASLLGARAALRFGYVLLAGSLGLLAASIAARPVDSLVHGAATGYWPEALWTLGLLGLAALAAWRGVRPPGVLLPDARSEKRMRLAAPVAALLVFLVLARRVGGAEQAAALVAGSLALGAFLLRLRIGRKKPLDLIEQNEEHTRHIIDAAFDAVITIDVGGQITAWNAQAAKTFGWTEAEAIGRSLVETIMPPALRTDAQQSLESYLEIGAGSTPNKLLERTAIKRSGEEIPVEIAISPLRTSEGLRFSAFVRDISARKLAEQRLVEAEARYRTLVEELPLVTYINGTDENVPVVYISPQIDALMGYSAQEFQADPGAFPRVLHPEDRDRVLEEHGRTFETGAPLRTEYRVIARNGKTIWFEDSGSIVRDDEGTPFLHGYVLDITERKRAEQELALAEDRYRKLAEHLPLVTYINSFEEPHELLYVSPQIEDILGYSTEELLANPRLLPESVHEDDRARVTGEAARWRREGGKFTCQYRCLAKDGRAVWFEDVTVPVRDVSGNLQAQGYLLDITDRVRGEQRLAAQHAVTNILAGSAALAESAARILETLCEGLDWDFGAIWQADTVAQDIRCVDVWHRLEESGLPFAEETRTIVLSVGHGLPGRVCMTGEPFWSPDLATDPTVVRKAVAYEAGLHGAIGFPILAGQEVLGAIEFFSREVRAPDEELLQMMSAVGSQIGQFMVRAEAEKKMRGAEEKYRLLIEQLPLVTYVDKFGEHCSSAYISPQAETLLGYPLQAWSDPDLFSKVLHPDDRERVLAAGERWFESPDRWVDEYRLISSDGRTVWVHDEAVAVLDEQGQPAFSQGFYLDITERKEAESKLQDATDRLTKLMANMHGAVYRCALDSDWTMEFISDGIIEISGYPPSDFIGNSVRTYASIIHPDDVGMVEREIVAAVERDEQFALEYRVIGADGSVRWLLERGQAVRDEDGAALWLDGVFFDITERIESEEELRQSEERFRLYFDHAPIGMALTAPDGRFLRVNAALCEIVGYPEEELVGRTFQSITHPDDLSSNMREVQQMLVGNRSSIQIDKRYVHKDGHAVWVLTTSALLRDAQGGPAVLVTQIQDMTEKKRAEEHLRLEAERMAEIIATQHAVATAGLELDAIISLIAGRAQALTGGEGAFIAFPEGDEIVYRAGTGTMADHPGFRLKLDRSLIGWTQRTGKIARCDDTATDVRIDASSSRSLGIRSLIAVPLHNDRGASGVLEVCSSRPQAFDDRDVRTLELMAGLLAAVLSHASEFSEQQAENQRLLELDRLKDEFVALVSHELRTPLTSIRGYLELVLEGEAGGLTNEQAEFLGIVDRNAVRLLQLVGDLLFVAQIEAGSIGLQLADVDLDLLAAESVATAVPVAEKKEITLTLESGGSARVSGDRVRLGQVLDNFVSNAIKFTPAGGSVMVRVLPDAERVVLEVADTGIGIPAEEQARIGERFFRTSEATKQAIQGTGLGLAISKAIIHAHDGDLTLESKEGVGTTFRVSIPALGIEPVFADTAHMEVSE
jgi:PAS domain S-box-containing protein